jgi:BMFP domain-containing protein YqiC
MIRSQAERFLRGMDLPQREEFEAVKAMAEKARAENEELKRRIEALEAVLRGSQGEPKTNPQENPGHEPGLTV